MARKANHSGAKKGKGKPAPTGLRAFRLPGKPKASPKTAPDDAALAARRLAAARRFAAEEDTTPPAVASKSASSASAPAHSPPSMAGALEIRAAQAGNLRMPEPLGDEFEVKKARPAPVVLPDELAALGKPRAPEPAPAAPGKASPPEDGPLEVRGGTSAQVVKADDGMQVLAKGASKFSAEDLELLKRLIVPKGQSIIDGFNLDLVKFNDEGLVPVVAQDAVTGAVVAQNWANREALEKTLRSKQMTYWNRKAEKLVVQGEDSGRVQKLVRLAPDCDNDALLAVVDQDGPACHRDTGTCWSEGKAIPVASALGDLDRFVADKAKAHDGPTGKLAADPVEAMKALVEQTKHVVGALRGQGNATLEKASADLLYHLVVACRAKGVGVEAVLREVRSKAK